MSTNPILDELHAARAKLLADAGGDLDKLVMGIRQRQLSSGHRLVAVPVGESHRTKESTGAADNAVPDGGSSPARKVFKVK